MVSPVGTLGTNLLEAGRAVSWRPLMTSRAPCKYFHGSPQIIRLAGSCQRALLLASKGVGWRQAMPKSSPFKYFKASPEIIRLVVMLQVRFPLSLRNVEDLLNERRVDVSHEAIRFWWHRFRIPKYVGINPGRFIVVGDGIGRNIFRPLALIGAKMRTLKGMLLRYNKKGARRRPDPILDRPFRRAEGSLPTRDRHGRLRYRKSLSGRR